MTASWVVRLVGSIIPGSCLSHSNSTLVVFVFSSFARGKQPKETPTSHYTKKTRSFLHRKLKNVFLSRNNVATSKVTLWRGGGFASQWPTSFQVVHWCSNLPFSIVSLKKRTPFMTTKLKNNCQDKRKKLLCWQGSNIITICQNATVLQLLKPRKHHAWKSRKEINIDASVTSRHEKKAEHFLTFSFV